MGDRPVMRSQQHIFPELNTDTRQEILKRLSPQDMANLGMVSKTYRDLVTGATQNVLNVTFQANLARPVRPPESELDYSDEQRKKAYTICASLALYIRRRRNTLHTIIIQARADGLIAQQVLEASRGCTALRILHLQDYGDLANPLQAVVLKNLPPTLRVLRLSHHVSKIKEEILPKQLTIFHGFHPWTQALQQPGAFNLFQGVKALRVQDGFRASHIYPFLSCIQGLVHLSLTSVPKADSEFWGQFQLLPNLKRLTLEDVWEITSSRTGFDRNSKLISLDIDALTCSLNDAKNLLQVPQLRTLSIRRMTKSLSDELIFPSHLIHASNLEGLYVGSWGGNPAELLSIDIAELLSLPKLRLLALPNSEKIHEIDAWALPKLKASKLQPSLKANLVFRSRPSHEMAELLDLMGFQWVESELEDNHLQKGLGPYPHESEVINGISEPIPQYHAEIKRSIQQRICCQPMIAAMEEFCMQFCEAEVYRDYTQFLKLQRHHLIDPTH